MSSVEDKGSANNGRDYDDLGGTLQKIEAVRLAANSVVGSVAGEGPRVFTFTANMADLIAKVEAEYDAIWL